MKTSNFLPLILGIFAFASCSISMGQVTQSNNAPTLGNYVGFDASSNIPLPIRNDGNVPIEFFTGTNLAAPPRMFIRANGFVGIGSGTPSAKFAVHMDEESNGANSDAVYVINEASGLLGTTTSGFFLNRGLSSSNIAIQAEIEGTTLADAQVAGNFVVRHAGNVLKGVNAFVVPNSDETFTNTESVGVDGFVTLGSSVDCVNMYGVRGRVTGGASFSNIGVYGEAPAWLGSLTTPPFNLAGAFIGQVFGSGGLLNPSDASLKEEIQPIENALELINELKPYTYRYLTNTRLKTSDDLQMGFLAQDVEEIFPDMVKPMGIPAMHDENGEVLEEAITFKSMRYNDFIALLVAGIQEQSHTIAAQDTQLEAQDEALANMQSQLDAQTAQLTAMQESLATALAAMELAKSNMDNCCQNKATGSASPAYGSPQLQQNVPNPFEGSTRIDFSLPETAQVRLEISDSQGRSLETLINGQMAAGSHSTTWDGSRYSPGMYYYSLYANGELLSKKMIKR